MHVAPRNTCRRYVSAVIQASIKRRQVARVPSQCIGNPTQRGITRKMNPLRIHYIVTVLITIALALQLAMGAPLNFPVPVLTKRVLKILSESSGKYVTVSKSHRVNARASISKLRIGMAFYPVHLSVDRIQLESARYPGNFLTINNGTLLVDVPSENVTSVLEITPVDATEMVTLRNEDGCYVGFNALGKAKNLCELAPDDVEVRLTLSELTSAELKELGLDEENSTS